MQSPAPKRVVLRLNEKYELQEAEIIERFFTQFGPKPVDDFFSHLCPANESSNMHIVLDIHCRTVSTVELQTIPYEVFKVRKNNELYANLLLTESVTNVQVSQFERLLHGASESARLRCNVLRWGTTKPICDPLSLIKQPHHNRIQEG